MKKISSLLQKDLTIIVEENGYAIHKIQIEKIPDLDPIINIQISDINLEQCYELSKEINLMLEQKHSEIRKKYIIDISTKQIEEENEN